MGGYFFHSRCRSVPPCNYGHPTAPPPNVNPRTATATRWSLPAELSARRPGKSVTKMAISSFCTHIKYVCIVFLLICYCWLQKDNMAVFSGGQLRPAADKDATNRRRKWPVPGGAQGSAVYIGEKLVCTLLLLLIIIIIILSIIVKTSTSQQLVTQDSSDISNACL